MELDDAVEELDPLSFLLGRLLDQLCARLAARSLAAASIRVRFELQPAFENALDVRKEMFRQINPPGVYEKELQLPIPARDSKMLLKLLRLRLQSNPPAAPIRKIVLGSGIRAPARHAGRLVSSQFSRSRKTGGHHRAHCQRGRRRKCRLAIPGGYLAPGRISDAAISGSAGSRGNTPQPRSVLLIRESRTKISNRRRAFESFARPFPQRSSCMQVAPRALFFKDCAERCWPLPAHGAHPAIGGAKIPGNRTNGIWRFISILLRRAATAAAASRPDCGLYRFYFDALRGSWFVRGIYD